MRSALLVLGLSAFIGVAMTSAVAAAPATPVGKVLKKVQEEARRKEAKEPPPKPEEKPAVKRPVKVTISKETTYITSPLRPDGYPDYVAALDAIAARGVTPENNAVVLLVQAFGPKVIREEHREQYFKKLGIPPLPEDGPYFVQFDLYLDQLRMTAERDGLPTHDRDEGFDQYARAMDHPWSAKDCPLLAGWLKANEKPLGLIVEALQRPRYYEPLPVTEDVSLLALGHGRDISRMCEIARILHIRAMRLLHEGNETDAWRELSSAHRLPPLIAQSPVLVDLLVAGNVRHTVLLAQRSLLHSGKYTAAQLRAMRAEISALPTLPQVADRIGLSERFLLLDAACRAARGGYTSWQFLDEPGTYKEPPVDALRNWLLAGHIDWNEVLRKVNDFTDRFVAAGRKSLFRDRQAALGELYRELGALDRKAVARVPRLLAAIEADLTRFQDTEQVAAYLIALFTMPGLQLMLWEYEAATQVQLTDIALALALYRTERGAYPEGLEQLVPKYVAEVPKDCYSDAAFRYKREGTGYLLYSFGPNGKDDGGRGRFMDPPPGEDEQVPEDADDIGFRMPALNP